MGLFGFIRRVARSVRRVARRVFHSAKRAVRSAARFVRHAVSRVVHRVRRVAHRVRTTVRATVSHIVHRTRSFARRVFHSVRRIYHSARHAFHSAGRSIRKGLRRTIEGTKNYVRHVKSRVRNGINRMKNKLRNAWNWMKNKAKDTFNYVKKKVTNVTNAIWDGSKRFVNGINGFVRDHPWALPAFAVPAVGLPLLIGGIGLANSGIIGHGSTAIPSFSSPAGLTNQGQGFLSVLDVFNPSTGGNANVIWQLLSGMSLTIPGVGAGFYLGSKVAGWYYDYRTLPDDIDISSWPWYKKMAVGWMAKGDAFIGQIGTAINQEIEAERERHQMMTEAFERDGIAGVLPYALEDTINYITMPFRAAASLVVGTYNYLSNEWKRDPWDGLWKTVGIVAGLAATVIGIVGAPVTGGASLALTALGVTMVASAVAVAGKESYEYTQAKTKKELFNLATDDTDEIVFVPSMAIGGCHTTRIGLISRLEYYPTKGTYVDKYGRTYVLTPDNKKIYIAATDGKYYVENPYYRRTLTPAGGRGLEAHEAYGEAAKLKGIVKPPKLLRDDLINYELGPEISVDKAASRFVGRKPIIESTIIKNGKHLNWWDPPSEGYGIYFDESGALRVAVASEIPKNVPSEVLSPADIRYYLDNTKIPIWYSPYTPGVASVVSTTGSLISNSTNLKQ